MGAPRTDLTPLGARLRSAREARGLSQQALAAVLGVLQSSVSAYETGASVIPLPTLRRWLIALEVDRATWGDFLADESDERAAS